MRMPNLINCGILTAMQALFIQTAVREVPASSGRISFGVIFEGVYIRTRKLQYYYDFLYATKQNTM